MDSRQNFSTLLTPSKTPSSPMTLKLPSPTKSFTSTISKNSYPLLSPTSKKHIPNITMVHDFNAQLPSDSETYSDDDEGVFFNGAVKKSSLKAKKVSRRKLRTPTVAVDKLTPSSSKKSSKVVNTSELKRENLVPKYLQVGSPFSS
ncbi:hypothetical protein HMI54_006552 [Coelomomyces lativittatus]|nr:hypothetical protein HMI54_006552 [Coelomomyces lativittatus]